MRARRSMILFTAAVLAAFTTPLTTPLCGTVVDSHGMPIEGASIWLLERPSTGNARIVTKGQSGEQGRFALERPIDLADEYRVDGTSWESTELFPIPANN